jgi:hypothetical protein
MYLKCIAVLLGMPTCMSRRSCQASWQCISEALLEILTMVRWLSHGLKQHAIHSGVVVKAQHLCTFDTRCSHGLKQHESRPQAVRC